MFGSNFIQDSNESFIIYLLNTYKKSRVGFICVSLGVAVDNRIQKEPGGISPTRLCVLANYHPIG